MLRAILFDFNGILVDDEPLHCALFQQVLGEEGVELSEESYYRDYLGFDDRRCFAAALVAAGRDTPPAVLTELIERKAGYYRQAIRRQGYPFFPGAVELVRETAAAGLALGVVSGALRDEVLGALEQARLADSVAVVVAAEDVAASKPDPQGYRDALAALNAVSPAPQPPLAPGEVLAIEDSPDGLAAARGAGLMTLGVAQTYPAEELDADQVAPALDGLTVEALQRLFAEHDRQ